MWAEIDESAGRALRNSPGNPKISTTKYNPEVPHDPMN